jgi:hypothetical protein
MAVGELNEQISSFTYTKVIQTFAVVELESVELCLQCIRLHLPDVVNSEVALSECSTHRAPSPWRRRLPSTPMEPPWRQFPMYSGRRRSSSCLRSP